MEVDIAFDGAKKQVRVSGGAMPVSSSSRRKLGRGSQGAEKGVLFFANPAASHLPSSEQFGDKG